MSLKRSVETLHLIYRGLLAAYLIHKVLSKLREERQHGPERLCIKS